MTLGHQNMLELHRPDAGHLCRDCTRQIVALTRTFWEGLWPGLFKRENS